MQAILSSHYGDPENLSIGQIELPEIGPKQVLVKVVAAGINPVDWKVLRGDARAFSGWRRPPSVLGADFAGVVHKVGEAVSSCQVGDSVFGLVPAFKGGAYAQFVAVETENFVTMPRNLSFIEAAAVPLVALTAFQFLHQKAPIGTGDHVLVNGCCGGLGHMAVKLAKAGGAKVTGVCSNRNMALAERLGCDQVIDYKRSDPLSKGSRYDRILDTASTMSFRDARKALTAEGAFATALPSPQNLLIAPILNTIRSQKNHALWVRPDAKALEEIRKLIEQDDIHPYVEQTFEVSQITNAFNLSKGGKVRGKLVLDFGSMPQDS